jgi:hypothetical protein
MGWFMGDQQSCSLVGSKIEETYVVYLTIEQLCSLVSTVGWNYELMISMVTKEVTMSKQSYAAW